MVIEVISFDLDGTLVEPGYIDAFWTKRIPELYSEREGLSLEEAKSYVMREYEKVGQDDLLWYVPPYWLSHFGINSPIEEILRSMRDCLKVYPEVPSVLASLRKRYFLVVTSNTPRELAEPVLELMGLKFGRVFSCVSDFKSVRKTEGFYLWLCSELGVNPSCVAHVGNDEYHDCKVPRAVGIRALHLNRGAAEPPVWAIRDLRELERRLAVA